MTSNLGSDIIREQYEKLNDNNRDAIREETKLQVFELLKRSVRPEFLNRIDETIMFEPLSKENMKDIVYIQLEQLKKRLIKNNIKLNVSEEAVDWLTQEGYDPQFGARPIKRIIQKEVLNELSKQLLGGNIAADATIVLDVFEHNIVFRKPINETEEA